MQREAEQAAQKRAAEAQSEEQQELLVAADAIAEVSTTGPCSLNDESSRVTPAVVCLV